MASTNCGQTDDACPMAANFASGVGPCVGIVEPFKHILCVTAHPQILALGLRAPMGVCLGQYGIYLLLWSELFILLLAIN